MSEQSDLLQSIANTTNDYRAGEIERPTPDHVDQWVQQFDGEVRTPLLRELNHVLKDTYLSRDWLLQFSNKVTKSKTIAGDDPCTFWRQTNFLKIQQNGHSQEEMLELLDESLMGQCGFATAQCGNSEGDYIYLDDVLFSGNRVANDLESWIRDQAPASATVYVIVAAVHKLGHFLSEKRLDRIVLNSGKNIKIKYRALKAIENRRQYKNDSEVLWPTALPDDAQVKAYAAKPHKFPFEPRQPGGRLGPFSSEAGRQLLERELLIAGIKILAKSKNPKDILRPLGFSPFGLGFGSMIITFRNCPNNCPLALWWGDPKATSGPFHWYPLLPRKTYEE